MRRLIVALYAFLALALPGIAGADAQRQQAFDGLTVHYNAFPSSILQPSVAEQTGLLRSRNQGVLNIAAVRDGKTVPASVTGSVSDRSGKERPLSFKQISEKGAVYYIAQFVIGPAQANPYRFTINIKAGGVDAHAFSFNQEIYADE